MWSHDLEHCLLFGSSYCKVFVFWGMKLNSIQKFSGRSLSNIFYFSKTTLALKLDRNNLYLKVPAWINVPVLP